MASDLSTELAAFTDFVAHHLGGTTEGASLEDSLAKFRAYQRDISELRSSVNEAEEDIAKGNIGTFDADATIVAIRERQHRSESPD